jgi:hypothetical protein
MRLLRNSAIAVLLAGTMLAGVTVASAQRGATTGVAPADRPALAGEVVPSPQDAAVHNPAVAERDQLPILAHTFNFTDEQKQQIRDALAAEKGGGSSNVTPTAGTEIPDAQAVKPVPDSLAQKIPQMKRYNYVKLGDKIAIVDPHLPVVVAVIE